MPPTRSYSAATRNVLTESHRSIAPSVIEGASKYITDLTAMDKMTEGTIQQLESGIPEVATSIYRESPNHMILQVNKPTYHLKLRDSGLQTTVTYNWSTQYPTKMGESTHTVLAKFVPEVWYRASSIGNGSVESLTPAYSEHLESSAAVMLQECFEDIIDQDGDALGVSFEAALGLTTKKCMQGSASICRSMGASVVDGLDGKGDPDSFFFETDNYSLTPGIDGSLSFNGHLTGEGWRDGSCNFSLRPADWAFSVSAGEVQSVKQTQVNALL